MDPGRPSAPTRPVVLVRADVDQRLGVAVVAVLQADEVGRAGRGADQPQRELVGLAAGVHEEADVEPVREGRDDALGVRQDGVVQVAGVGVEHRHLPRAGGDHARVRVPHVGHVVDRVQVGPALVVVQPRPDAAHDPQRVLVGQAQARGQPAPPVGQGVRERAHRRRHRVGGQSQQRAGVGRQAQPERALRRFPDTGVVVAAVEQVDDHLHVHVRRPVPVLGAVSRPGRARRRRRARRPAPPGPASRRTGGRTASGTWRRHRSCAAGPRPGRSRAAGRCRGRRRPCRPAARAPRCRPRPTRRRPGGRCARSPAGSGGANAGVV